MEGTLHCLARHAKNAVKRQQGSYNSSSSMQEVYRSRQRSSESLRHPSGITTVMYIRRDNYGSSTSSEGRKKKKGSRFRRQSKNEKNSAIVAPIKLHQRAPFIQEQEKADFCRLFLTKEHPAEEYHVFPSQVRFTFPQLRERKG